MRFTKDIKLKDIEGAADIAKAKGLLISGGDFFSGENAERTLLELEQQNPTWYHQDILYGLERLQKAGLEGGQYVYPVYAAQPTRLSSVRLIFLPPQKKSCDTYVILLAGGAYGAVCTMVEALPVAAKLNEMGITCFCLNYRTAVQESFTRGLLPEPLDDLAAALKAIQENQSQFGVDGQSYAVCGFSAGGHLASLWGTKHLGARKYGLPQPKALALAYPLISMEHVPEGPIKAMVCSGMFGAQFTIEDMRRYDASLHIDEKYPKTYLVRSADDPTVSREGAEGLMDAMERHGIPCRLEQAQSGGHGFGLGSATSLNGWVERAYQFLQ